MSPWPKRLLGFLTVAFVLLILLLMKSRSSAVPTPVGPTAVEALSATERSEIRRPGGPSNGPAAQVLIGASSDTTDAVKTMWRISGVVMTPDSEPVPHAKIWLGGHELLGWADAEGKFDLSGSTFPFPSDKSARLIGSTDGIQSPFVT